MATQKNQHYVPQFYQRYFSVDGKTIGSYVLRSRKKIDKAPIKTQASEDYLYTNDTTNPDNTEKKLGDIEKTAAAVLGKVIDNPRAKISKEEGFVIYVFTLLQLGRTIAQIERLREVFDKMMHQILKIEVKLGQERGDEKYDGITDEIIESTSINLKNKGMFGIGNHLRLIPTMLDLQIKILINNMSHSFITSDNPACLYNMFMEKCGQDQAGAGCRGVMLYLPLTPCIAVMFYDSNVYKLGCQKHHFVDIKNEADIRELNKLIAVASYETLLFNPSLTNVTELNQLADLSDKFTPTEKIEEIQNIVDAGGNQIIGNHAKSLKCYLSLTFMRYRPEYAYKTKETFNPETDIFREITQYKDDLEDRYFGKNFNK